MSKIQFGTIYSGLDDYIGPVEFAERAERWGYDSYWVPDFVTVPRLDAFVVLAAVAQRTSKLRLGTAVVPVPFRSPFQLAKTALSVDVLSGGRLDLGVGIGLIPRDFEVTRVDFHRRGSITDERLHIVRRLLDEENVSHQGRYHRFRDLTMEPRPVQRPSIPIWVAAVWKEGIAPGALKRVARFGDGFLPTDMTLEDYAKAREVISEYARSYGRDPGAIQWGVVLWTCLGDSREDAREKARAEIERRLGIQWRVEPERGYVLGTPADCAETITAFLELGITHIALDLVSPPADILSQQEALAREVLPHFRQRA